MSVRRGIAATDHAAAPAYDGAEMSRSHRQFVCSACAGVQARWMGKCPDCGEWNTLSERIIENVADDLHRPAIAPVSDEHGGGAAPVPLSQVAPDATRRWRTGLSEFDRVLGGGLVAGSAVLLGGDPGIGKSTLALQVAHCLAADGRTVLYVTSEESLGQVKLRAERLHAGLSNGVPAASLLVASQSNLDVILNQLRQNRPAAVIVDSIQMVYRPDLPSVPGSATQLRDCAARLIWLAKQMGFALILVGHVTKEGAIAGPKVLEHIVDCVIYFEGERFHSHRLIRAVKNRFGSTDELGIFAMTDHGLLPVEDPSRLFIDAAAARRAGSVILAAAEGTRVLLVEVQALCVQSVFGAAKRKTAGVDANRVAMILAVLEKHCGYVLGDQDVFVNMAGGVRIMEPAADLAIALAVAGALSNRALPAHTLAFGEVGLGGELRTVHHAHRRMAEGERIGMAAVLAPRQERSSQPRRASDSASPQKRPTAEAQPPRAADTAGPRRAIQLFTCETLQDALRHLA